MKIISATTFVAGVSVAAAATNSKTNPFAPKITPNNSESKRLGRLLSSATPLRELGGSAYDNYGQVDVSAYSIRFEKCSTVKQYNVDNNYEQTDTVLKAKRFVIFRLCPNHSCDANSCNENYGEYLIDVETYLDTMLQYKSEQQQEYCSTCNTCYNQAAQGYNDNAYAQDGTTYYDPCSSLDVNSCYQECLNIDNIESNGYVDAAEYVGCVKVYQNRNTGLTYYAGAVCNAAGTHIKIGMFTDEECTVQDETAESERYMKNEQGYNVKLSYHLLKLTTGSSDDRGCLASCTDGSKDWEYNVTNTNYDAQTASVCETLYKSSAKCENSHAFSLKSSGKYSQNWNEESRACNFIYQLYQGVYDESGEIIVTGGRRIIRTATSSVAQKFFLTFFVWGTVFMSAYVALLYHKIMKGQKSLLESHFQDGSALA